uniref:Beta-sarcoglycan n=1 Tax=Arion vulgaris TaxID=1028688 RepID=A0A0B7AHF3_9EUPU
MEVEEQNSIVEYNAPAPQPVGIYGWRKRCLYAFVLSLMAVVIINISLTVWILRVLDFSLDGMGRLRIVPKGFMLQGEAEFLKSVYVNTVKSEEGKSLYLQSNKAVELLTTDHKNKVTSKIVVDKKKIVAKCDTFQVEDTKGNPKLVITDKKVTLGNGDVSFPGDIKFAGSVRTPLLRSPDREQLEILSETSKVQISGMGGVSMFAEAGDVT